MENLERTIKLVNKEYNRFGVRIESDDLVGEFRDSSIQSLKHFYSIYLTRYNWIEMNNPEKKIKYQIKILLDNMDNFKDSINKVRSIVMSVNHKFMYIYTDEGIKVLLGLIGPINKDSGEVEANFVIR